MSVRVLWRQVGLQDVGVWLWATGGLILSTLKMRWRV